MKKILVPILLSALAVFTACKQDRLDIPQKFTITTDSFYQTEEDAEAAMVAVYQGVLWNICGCGNDTGSIFNAFRSASNLGGDDMYAAGSNFGDNDFMAQMDEFRYDSNGGVVWDCYKNIFYSLYYANLLIDKFKDRVGESKVFARTVAESRVLRAWMYMYLAIGWDNPPFVDHVLSTGEYPYNCNTDPEHPMSHEELLRWCASECEAVVNDLDERQSPSDMKGAVKVTKGFAWAIAGKSLLFAGDYAGAQAELQKVIDSKKYELVPGEKFVDLFHVEGDANQEKIFELNFQNNSSYGWGDLTNKTTWMESNIWGWRADHFVQSPVQPYTGIDGWGGLGVPLGFAEEMLANDGPDSYRFKTTFKRIDDAVYNTVYGVGYVDDLTLEQKKTGLADVPGKDKDGKDIVNHDQQINGLKALGLYGQSFYLPFKQLAKKTDFKNPGDNRRLNNYNIMRYAEVLLMYAECAVQTGSRVPEALDYVNDIQKRAGSKTISSSLDMDVVKKEKKYEMWLEGCRFFDCIRWGDIAGMEQAGQAVPELFDRVSAPNVPADAVVLADDPRWYIVYGAEAKKSGAVVGFKKGKHEHFPFPYKVVSRNPNMVQNPGW